MRSATFDVLLSRLLTRSGDQAWDFALAITLLTLFPRHTQLVIALFFASKAATIVFFPRLAMVIDDWRRLKTAFLGTSLQSGGVVLVTASLLALAKPPSFLLAPGSEYSPVVFGVLLFVLGVGSMASSLGQNLMDVAVGIDWLPGLVPSEGLAKVNTRLRQIDLLTEVGAPVAAGLLLAVKPAALPIAGFLCVALWNLMSFVPEMALLRRVVKTSDVLSRKMDMPAANKQSLVRKCAAGWADFFSQPTAPVMLASALLWLTVLSPHGILLTAYLKSEWKLSEAHLGFFRGAGAVVGLVATFVYPFLRTRLGLVRGSLAFLGFQATAVAGAGAFFVAQKFEVLRVFNGLVVFAFLACVVVSRLGLFGFLLGETEIRQVGIPEAQRGRVNGVATALTSGATLLLFAAGSVFPSGQGFAALVALSVAAVVSAAVLFGSWARKSLGSPRAT
ncbi:MAG: ABC transporter substrate-binding protein [Silvanigrellales bacterium]|nr:ABC transporter substrate-binding protein [Silvanigrellales bacterium]